MSHETSAPTKPNSEEGVRVFGDEFKVYGDTFALDIFSGMNKSAKSHVVNLKIARKIPGSNMFDWNGDWIWVQVSEIELAPLLSVLLGYRSSVSIEHYNCGVMKYLELRVNKNDSKGKSAKESGSSYVLTMKTQQMGSARAVRIEDSVRVRMSIFFFRVFMKCNGGVGQDVLYNMLRDIYGRRDVGSTIESDSHRSDIE